VAAERGESCGEGEERKATRKRDQDRHTFIISVCRRLSLAALL
jgi:hypothetical protein